MEDFDEVHGARISTGGQTSDILMTLGSLRQTLMQCMLESVKTVSEEYGPSLNEVKTKCKHTDPVNKNKIQVNAMINCQILEAVEQLN